MKTRVNLFMCAIAIFAVASISSCKKDATTEDEDATAFAAANGVNGAQIYDHALNFVAASQTDYPNENTNFFRCKSCHGWDLLGQKGVLINKASSATYPVVADVNLYEWSRSHTIREVFDAVKNPDGRKHTDTYDATHPDYSSILSDAQVWDVVKFLKETSHDVSDFYDMTTTGTYPTGTRTFANIGKGGDPVAGQVTYDAKCKVCHGADGKQIDVYCRGLFLGEMFRHDPHEMHHKSVWGMPNDREHVDAGCSFAGPMPAIELTDQDIRNMMVMGQNTTVFPD